MSMISCYLKLRFFIGSVLLSALLVSPVWASDLDKILQNGRTLVASGQNEEAFKALQSAELNYAGTPEFDYWLGVAAVRSGNASLGLLALDRLLLVQPNHAGGRLERALALIQLGMLEQADAELSTLQEMSPPPKAEEVIHRYRLAIARQRDQRSEPSHFVSLGFGVGYDSNVNSAPSDYTLELFGGLFQSEVSDEGSAFTDVRMQYSGNAPVNKLHSIQWGLSGFSRHYAKSNLSAYDLGVIQGRGNWRYSPSEDLVVNSYGDLIRVYSGSPRKGLFSQYGIGSSVSVPVLLESRLTLGLGWYEREYDRASVNDLNAFAFEWGLMVPLNSQWQLSSDLSYEQERADRRDGGNSANVKAQFGLDYKHNPAHQMRFSLSKEWVKYKEKGFALYNDFVPASRRDQNIQGAAEWVWTVNPQLIVSTQGSFRRQHASLDFFEYNQFSVSSNLTYLWR